MNLKNSMIPVALLSRLVLCIGSLPRQACARGDRKLPRYLEEGVGIKPTYSCVATIFRCLHKSLNSSRVPFLGGCSKTLTYNMQL